MTFFKAAVPPTRSEIPDLGPYPDFFGQTGPEFCQKSEFLITHGIGFFWHLLNKSANVNFTMKVLGSLDFSNESEFLMKMVQI